MRWAAAALAASSSAPAAAAEALASLLGAANAASTRPCLLTTGVEAMVSLRFRAERMGAASTNRTTAAMEGRRGMGARGAPAAALATGRAAPCRARRPSRVGVRGCPRAAIQAASLRQHARPHRTRRCGREDERQSGPGWLRSRDAAGDGAGLAVGASLPAAAQYAARLPKSRAPVIREEAEPDG